MDFVKLQSRPLNLTRPGEDLQVCELAQYRMIETVAPDPISIALPH